jgi:anti-sigma factor RsiW
MTRCGDWPEFLSARLDDALPADDRERTDAHVAGCRDCRERLESLRALKHALARLPSREAPPGAVRAHVEALALRRPSGVFSLTLRFGLAACLVGATWGLVALFSRQALPDAHVAAELAADHLHSVPEAMPAEVVTEDPAEAVRFFSGRVPFPPVAPRLDGARLVGGRLCKIQGRRVQLLFYRAPGDETVSLFVSDQGLGGAGCREARGLQVCSRKAGGLTLLAVGGGPSGELRRRLDTAALVPPSTEAESR